jgi:PAS domain S-box-containing protein
MQNEELRRSQLELEEAHNQQVDLYDFAPVGYVTLDGDGVIISANLTAATLLGVERGTLLRRRFPVFVAGVDGDRWHRAFLALLQGDERAVHRLTLTRGDEATFDADVVCERRSGHDGNRVRIVLTDVTGIARIERVSHETKERLSLVIDSTGSGYTDWDIPSGRVKYSRRFASMLGYDLGELEPTVATWERLVHPDDRQRAWDSAQPHLRGEIAQYECEERLQHKDGRWLWTMLRARVVARDAGGAPLRFVGTHTDITDRKRAEEALAESERRLRDVLVAATDGYWERDLVTGRVFHSARMNDIVGRPARDDVANTDEWRTRIHPEDLDRIAPQYDAVMEGRQERTNVTYRVRHEDGLWRWVRARGSVVARDPAGNPTRFAGTVTDIQEMKVAEEAIALSEAKYRGLFDSLRDGFVRVALDGAILEFNETYREMLGYSADELKRKTYQELTPERWHLGQARIMEEQVVRRGYSDVYEKEYRRKDGTVFPVEIRAFLLKEAGRPTTIWGIVRDVTETRTLQAQVALSSRLAAMGSLVAGVGHEINNPLAAELADQGLAFEVVREVREHLAGNASLDRPAEARALDSVLDALKDAQEAGKRIARIVKDLSVFGQPDSTRRRAQLTDILDGALRWLPATIARTASLRVENLGAPDVVASPGQIEQVVVNLVTNAAKATPEGGHDTVILRIGPGTSGTARLEVIDHGTGIEPTIRERIFDPFFTTRPTGPNHGSGLGLAICHAIVTAHGGTLTVESVVGKGSTFRMELPAAPAEA